MAKVIVDDLAVCESCLLYIANGDAGNAEDNAAAQKGLKHCINFTYSQASADLWCQLATKTRKAISRGVNAIAAVENLAVCVIRLQSLLDSGG